MKKAIFNQPKFTFRFVQNYRLAAVAHGSHSFHIIGGSIAQKCAPTAEARPQNSSFTLDKYNSEVKEMFEAHEKNKNYPCHVIL